ncbi:MAG: hypothetical protein E7372_02415 [Clostridiales bacterium]|nr:hypothetical protein [Clostridiales bacterium]
MYNKIINCKNKKCNKACDKIFYNSMKVLTIFETNNKGKTKMLSQVINLMTEIESGFTCIAYKQKNHKSSIDKTYVFKQNKSGLIIGITTKGDTCCCLAKEFLFMQNYNCDLYICASHIKGETIDWLLKRTEKGLLVRWRKEIANLKNIEDICNENQAKKLFILVNNLLSSYPL